MRISARQWFLCLYVGILAFALLVGVVVTGGQMLHVLPWWTR